MLAELEFFAVCNGRWIKENSLAEAEEEEEICLIFTLVTAIIRRFTIYIN